MTVDMTDPNFAPPDSSPDLPPADEVVGRDLDDSPHADADAETSGDDRAVAKRRRSEARLVKLTVDKYEAIASNDDQLNAVIAAVLECNPDPASITRTVMSGGRATGQALNDVNDLSGLSELEVGIAVASMERTQMRAVWVLLEALGATSGKKSLPAASTKAALAVAGAIQTVTDDGNQQLLAAAAAAIKKR